ncbi:hypothetical protein PLAN_70184 [Planktothrix rubescens CCAP 1459/22]|uniref:Uncharacterized protein n=1 Tax=Planktothrix rubescens CCAP 1459/22 TaxID=329571 RepID=A0A6J7ZRM5_PLARU|nr:hypothetical protein PLAN_70184 [Planktothrix rubescens NIVA-CYA 18]
MWVSPRQRPLSPPYYLFLSLISSYLGLCFKGWEARSRVDKFLGYFPDNNRTIHKNDDNFGKID